MIHGDLKGVRFRQLEHFPILTSLPVKANILIDKAGHARLADFGLLTIISDPANCLSSNSCTQGGTVRWMSPELIDPCRFGLESQPTKSSDCYALGMVVYETISGNVPFHKHTDLTVLAKVIGGEHPPRGRWFTESLWNMLGMCWGFQPKDRPSIEDVLECLEMAPSSLEQPSPGLDDETEEYDGWGSANSPSGVPDRASRTSTMSERSTTTSSGLSYSIDHPLNPILTAPGPSMIDDAINEGNARSLGREGADLDPLVSRVDSDDGGTYQASATWSCKPLATCVTHCLGPTNRFRSPRYLWLRWCHTGALSFL